MKRAGLKVAKLSFVTQVAAAVAVFLVMVITGFMILSDNNVVTTMDPLSPSEDPAQSSTDLSQDPTAPVKGDFEQWDYLEYAGYVVLTDYRLTPAADNAHILIPTEIHGKPVTDIAEECFMSIREQSVPIYGSFLDMSLFWEIAEDNPYFLLEESRKALENEDGTFWQYNVAIYNKDKTTLFYAQDEFAHAMGLVIPKTVTKIYNGALSTVYGPITLEEGVEHFIIEGNMLFTKDKTRLISCAFKQSLNDLSYRVPKSVTSLDSGAFYMVMPVIDGVAWPEGGWEDVTLISVELPEGIREIPDYAFMSGSAAPLKIPSSVERIGNYALDTLAVVSLEISINVREIGVCAFQRDNILRHIIFNDNNPWFTMESGVLYNKDKTELIVGQPDAFAQGYQMPDTVKIIRRGALEFIDDYLSPSHIILVIPESVETIEENAIDFHGQRESAFTVYGKSGSCIEKYVSEYNEMWSRATLWVIDENDVTREVRVNQLIKFLPLGASNPISSN